MCFSKSRFSGMHGRSETLVHAVKSTPPSKAYPSDWGMFPFELCRPFRITFQGLFCKSPLAASVRCSISELFTSTCLVSCISHAKHSTFVTAVLRFYDLIVVIDCEYWFRFRLFTPRWDKSLMMMAPRLFSWHNGVELKILRCGQLHSHSVLLAALQILALKEVL